jgi:mono/diheme cytochrome c family protein
MRTRLLLSSSLAIAAACGSSSKPATSPSTEPDPALAAEGTVPATPIPVDPAMIERGAYVAAVAGCATCHTPRDAHGNLDTARALAGGFEMPMPGGKGVWRAPNITPDPTTGIGTWTTDQIEAAIRMGKHPTGQTLAPIMPSAYFARMTDADTDALVVFLRAQAPVAHKVARSSGLDVPAEITPVEAAAAGDSASDQRTHGEYLATLMHCSGCHTPETGAHAGKPFAGGNPFDRPLTEGGGTIYSANITPDPRTGIGSWTQEDIMRSVREMKRPDGEPLHGPMTLYRDAWSKLTDDDARAIAVYLMSVPAVENTIVHAQRERRLKSKTKVAVRTSTP